MLWSASGSQDARRIVRAVVLPQLTPPSSVLVAVKNAVVAVPHGPSNAGALYAPGSGPGSTTSPDSLTANPTGTAT